MNEQFQALLQACADEGLAGDCYPSMAAAAGVKDEILATAFAGEAPLPGMHRVDQHTLYDMASISKIVGPTMIVLRALEAGQISLDETISDFIPNAPFDKRDITIRQIMTHTGGFEAHFRLDHMLKDPADVLDCILHYPLAEKPGTRPIYSCMGYITLGKLLEIRFGKPLNELARERVFEPLHLDHTTYCPSEGVFAATELEEFTQQPLIGVVHDENARFQHGNSANAGVFMPLEDGIRFCQMLGGMGKDFLRRETLEMAITNYTPGQEQHRGIGFQLAGSFDCFFGTGVPDQCFGHTGFTGTSFIVEPSTGFWVMLLTNRVYPQRVSRPIYYPLRRRIHAECWALYQKLYHP